METMASVRAILEEAQRRSKEIPTATSLSEVTGNLTIEQVIRAAEAGDKVAYQVLTEAGDKFGIGLAMAVNMFGPRLVIVGGTLASPNAYLEAAKRMVRFHALGKANSDLAIQPSRLDHLAGARGAASQVLNRLFSPGEKNLLNLNNSLV